MTNLMTPPPPTLTPPLPSGLKNLCRLDAPLHVERQTVARLLEFWGFTRNGPEFLRKLVSCGALTPVRLSHQRGCRYLTREVLGLWVVETVRES